MDPNAKKSSNWLGYSLSAVGGFVLGFGAGWVSNDMARAAEENPPTAKPPGNK